MRDKHAPMRTWFTADLHHMHDNIVVFTDRPYATVDEMHDAFRETWNRHVKPQDRVFVIGDVSFEKTGVRAEAWIKSLNGQKFLVAGNHDYSDGVKKSIQWNWVKDYADIRVDGDRVILFHFPILSWHQMHRGSYHLHGHCHGGLRLPWRLRNARILDVGVDAVVRWCGEYRPVEWNEIKAHLADKRATSVDYHAVMADMKGRVASVAASVKAWFASLQ